MTAESALRKMGALFWFSKALRPCVQMSREVAWFAMGVLRIASTNSIHQEAWLEPGARPSRGLQDDDFDIRGSQWSSATPSKRLRGPFVCRRIIPTSPSGIHRSGDARTGGEVISSCSWMAWHRPCPRSSLTVPLPRARCRVLF
jgi:hypothetical protein